LKEKLQETERAAREAEDEHVIRLKQSIRPLEETEKIILGEYKVYQSKLGLC